MTEITMVYAQFFEKIEISDKNRNFGQKSKFWGAKNLQIVIFLKKSPHLSVKMFAYSKRAQKVAYDPLGRCLGRFPG